MTSGNEELRALHDTQLRGYLPEVPPVGAVTEQDGPLIRTHYGTHGRIDYRHLPNTGLDELIARQRDAFAARGERGEWKVYAHDTSAHLLGKLRTAGFTPGSERALLVAPIDQSVATSSARLREAYETLELEQVARIAAGAGPHRTAFTEFLTVELPGITEPAASVTWHLGALDGPDDNAVDRLQSIIQHGLRTCATVGEPLYWLDWQHVGYCFDPRRVCHAGQPPWPGGAFPDGDYYLYLTSDLRIGTFGHPWEHTLCVFGTEFLAQVEDDLTDLLGAAVRHGGHRIGDT